MTTPSQKVTRKPTPNSKIEKGSCCICGEETQLYCHSCEDKEEDFRLWYCEKHYETTVMTGNCCRGNEESYEN